MGADVPLLPSLVVHFVMRSLLARLMVLVPNLRLEHLSEGGEGIDATASSLALVQLQRAAPGF